MMFQTIYRPLWYILYEKLGITLSHHNFSFLDNPEYRATTNFLNKSQWWSKKDLEKYQISQLRSLLKNCSLYVPYYQRLFHEERIKPEDIRNLADLQKLPFLTKEIVKKNRDDFIPQNIPKNKLIQYATGATTGEPLTFFYNNDSSPWREWAFIKNLWSRIGYHYTDRIVLFSARSLTYKNPDQFFEFRYNSRWLDMSLFHITKDSLPTYCEKISEFRPKYIYGIPSLMYELATYARDDTHCRIPGLKGILMTSEICYPWQRSVIEEIFDCRVFTWYGNREQTVSGGECEKSPHYHIFPQYGIMELIDENDRLIQGKDTLGEIVTTGFINTGFPLIRYRTQDMGSLLNTGCKLCGRQYPVLKEFLGRQQDFLICENKDKIPCTLLFGLMSFHELAASIRQIQFVQEEPGALNVRVVINKNEEEYAVQNLIMQILNKVLQGSVDVQISFVDTIERTKSGKYRYFIKTF